MPHETDTDIQPEKIYFRHLTREDGLPSNNIRWISVDCLGYVWIATDNGVARYDGTEMRVFQYVPGDTNFNSGKCCNRCTAKPGFHDMDRYQKWSFHIQSL